VLSIFARKAAGALGASGFPCALDLSRVTLMHHSGELHAAGSRNVPEVGSLEFESATDVGRVRLRFAGGYPREIQLTCRATGASLK
jgi:hypothetical protein